VIAVAARENERAVAAEFFELFKTPWELFQRGDSAGVLLCTGDEIPVSNAKLVLIYGSGLNSFDRTRAISIHPQPAGRFFIHGVYKIPVYGPGLAFENGGLYEVKNGSQTIVRIGYDLFSEVRHLLTAGQPAEHAAMPALDDHIELLRGLIVQHAPPLVEIPPVPTGKNFIACLTHDVDHVGIRNHKFDHTMLGFLARATFGSVLDVLRGKKTPGQLFANWLAALKLPFVHLGLAKDFWYQFDHYVEIEDGLPSTFFVIPKKGETGLDANGNRPARRAASYDARDLAEILRGLKNRGKEICVHGIDAWRDVSAGSDEKKIIAGLAGIADSGIRMHWLYFGEQSHEILEQSGYAYDSTIGYNGTVGYRAGTSQVFKPLAAKKMLELPMHVMDTALFYPSYLNLTPGQAAEKIRPLIAHAENSGGTLVVNWHDRSIAPERLWDGNYRAFIRQCKKSGAWFATAGQAVDWFRARRDINFENGGLNVRPGNSGTRGLPAFRVRVHVSAGNFADRELCAGMEAALPV
jgi:hypothetical protein